ncbi:MULTISPECIES: CaiB/BaiF CoA transferase family protein [unclassified Nocardioides]|uniref:CaiB/BaiF CoA transferase family protein n=1 Tax=unclassified Nocardioides TaxID=2615069 RepID=UPI0007011584|nr:MULTISPECIES: CoA transferase [unclassified Nocardioides]KRA37823.1 carnitine dehydratase [Nocardioides sp. Root614]KRA91783.1 carnitine dehydratase [Nocardioides sp. Root682]
MRPLEGVRVVELAHVAAGPFTGMLLADLGADVVKVEPPGGDQMRAWPPFATEDDGRGGEERFSHNFASVNRNKRSVVADLKDPADLARVRELVAAADVVVENYRPGVLDRLGLGYDTVREGHRGLVYCSISGYGLTSPYVDHGAYDVVIQGMSGLMSVTGEVDGDPVKAGVPVGDFTAGLYAAYTIAAVLPQVRDSGTSTRLDCPMLDCLLGVSALQTSEYWGSGVEPRRLGTAHPRNAPYQGFAAADAAFTVAAGNDRLWAAVAEVVGLPGLVEDPRFLHQVDRVRHQHDLEALLQARFAEEKRDHWITALRARGVPCGPVNAFGEILADPHVEATGLVGTVDVPVAGPTPTVVFPVRVEGLTPRLDRGAPRLDADVDVYDEWSAR